MATTEDEEKQKVMTFWQTFLQKKKEAYKEHNSISSRMHQLKNQAILSSVIYKHTQTRIIPKKQRFTKILILFFKSSSGKENSISELYFIYLNFMERTFSKEFCDQDLSPTKRITAWNHVSVPQNSQQMKQKNVFAWFSFWCLGFRPMFRLTKNVE